MGEMSVFEELPSSMISDDDVFEPTVLLKGWMWKSPPLKKLKARKDWERRYFKLLLLENIQSFLLLLQSCKKKVKHEDFCPYCLVYYGLSKEQMVFKPLRAINLRGCTVEDKTHAQWTKSFPHIFHLKTGKRIFFLSPENERARSEWIQRLNEVISLADSHENPVYQSMKEIRRELNISPERTSRSNSTYSESSVSTSSSNYKRTTSNESTDISDSESYHSRGSVSGLDEKDDATSSGNDEDEYVKMSGFLTESANIHDDDDNRRIYDRVRSKEFRPNSINFCTTNDCGHHHLIPPKITPTEERPPIIPRTRRPTHIMEEIKRLSIHSLNDRTTSPEKDEEELYAKIDRVSCRVKGAEHYETISYCIQTSSLNKANIGDYNNNDTSDVENYATISDIRKSVDVSHPDLLKRQNNVPGDLRFSESNLKPRPDEDSSD